MLGGAFLKVVCDGQYFGLKTSYTLCPSQPAHYAPLTFFHADNLMKYMGDGYAKGTHAELKGLYPKELLPAEYCAYALPLISGEAVMKDARTAQRALALRTMIAESNDDVDSLQAACEASLALTGGKVTELTPVGIPESYAFALQSQGKLKEALGFYIKVLDGIKSSVVRQKSDAIVLQACLVQAQFDKAEALKMAFTYSPHFSSAQRFGTVGAGRAILVQQCAQWAVEDLKFASLIDAEEKMMHKE
jgi:hypothetical protein